MAFFRIVFCFFLFILPAISSGQSDSSDSYVELFTSKLTTRLYEVSKFNAMQFNKRSTNDFITYSPNTNINVGFGFNYRGLGLNFAMTQPILNSDNDVYGKTYYLNWDGTLYLRKFTGLAFLEIYKGYYLSDNDKRRPVLKPARSLGIRSDIFQIQTGFSGTYVFNHKKFSYRASYTQDAWQKKSAGSFLLGGFVTYLLFQGDSNITGPDINKSFEDIQLSDIVSVDLGPMAGYIHTFVFRKHWFSTLALNAGFGYNYLKTKTETGLSYDHTNNLNSRFHSRLAFGYNSRLNFIGISYYNEINNVHKTDFIMTFNTGQFRINLVHRFKVGNMGFLDKIMNRFPWLFLPKDFDERKS